MNDNIEWACRTYDGLQGERLHTAESEASARSTARYFRAISATRNTYGIRVEVLYRVDGGDWQAGS